MATRMNNKYRAKKVVVNGETYHSQKEYQRWLELNILARAGVIHDLMRQVKFELIPAQYETYERFSKKTGKRLTDGKRCVELGVYYIADFVYWDGDHMVVEDSKGYRTDDYIIKRKLMLWVHGIKIKET